MRCTVLASYDYLHQIELEQLQHQELPLARFQSLFANANRDSKTKPFTPEDFLTFRRPASTKTLLSATTAAALLSLRADNHIHPLLLACWTEVLAAANDRDAPPEVRALISDDEQVWVIAPQWEDESVRGLVCVGDFIHGPILLRDIDRQLMTYRLQLPKRPTAAAGWVEAGHLLLPAT